MPTRKKKSKAKGRKPAAGKGGGAKGTDNAAANEGTLDSEMQRLKIGEQKGDGDEDDVEAMLEQAIKLAAVEEQEMKVKEKENCTHGYNPSSRFQARHCEYFLKIYMEAFYAATREGDSQNDRLNAASAAFHTAVTMSTNTAKVSTNKRNRDVINLLCLAEGTKFILDGKSDAARAVSYIMKRLKRADEGKMPDVQKQLELLDGDEHTLVQFFRKQIPCSCLDEKYKEVKSITKMGICFNERCPLPGHMAVRSKMMRCTRCRNINYCSRECQEADWPMHKEFCGKTVEELQRNCAQISERLRAG